MEGQLLVYPLYYKFSEGDIPENIRRCEEISRQCGAGCVFRIVEHTNYHLSSILTDNGYGLEKCGVVGEWNLTTDTGELCMKEKVQGGLFMKNGNGGTDCRSSMGGGVFAGPISTVVIRKIRRRNPSEKRIERWIYRMKNVSW